VSAVVVFLATDDAVGWPLERDGIRLSTCRSPAWNSYGLVLGSGSPCQSCRCVPWYCMPRWCLWYSDQKYSRIGPDGVCPVQEPRGLFQNVPVASGRISQLDGKKGVSTKPALKAQDTTRKAGPVYGIPHGYRQMGLETRFRCSRVSTGRGHWTEVMERRKSRSGSTSSADSERYTPCCCYRRCEE